jgi:diadenylate cyclase
MTDLWRIITRMGVGDVIDILIISAFFYIILRLMRGERTTVPQRGFVLAVLASVLTYFIAVLFKLAALQYLFENLGIVMVLVLIVVFQNEFRRGLAELGRIKLVRTLFSQGDVSLREIVQASAEMSARRMGALIAIERDMPLRQWIERGIILEARVTSETIRTVFTPPSPLHDGALIVRGDRLAAAGCILPLTTNEALARELGTRHRAALGLSEETDAVIVVVSEETGKISVAVEGRLERPFEPTALGTRLGELLGVSPDGR